MAIRLVETPKAPPELVRGPPPPLHGGPLTFLRIWHDNSAPGKRKGWYLDQIHITDLQTADR